MKKILLILILQISFSAIIFSQEHDENFASITIQNGVTVIEEYQFSDYENLKTVTLPKSIKKIECHAFDGCKNLKSINLPESIIEIGIYAFSGCKSLKSIKIPSKVTKLDSGTFFECESLEAVYLPKNLKEISDGPGTYGAFNRCSSLRYVDSPIDFEKVFTYTIIKRIILSKTAKVENIPSSIEIIQK